MKVKIDTREKFHVITIQEPHFAANMTEQMDSKMIPLLDYNVKNVIINCQDIQTLDSAAAAHILTLQHQYYDLNASFVVCGLHTGVKKTFIDLDLLDQLNHTPTESEAMDIVQLEEIERELGDI